MSHFQGRNRLNVEQLEDRWVPSATDFVRGLYTDVLHRAGSDAEVNSWVQLLNGGFSGQVVAQAFVHSDEHHGVQVDALYQSVFGRAADPGGRNFWVQNLRSNVDIAAVERSLILSTEFQNAHSSNSAFVGAVYQTVLGRVADNSGLQSWTNALNGGLSREAMVRFFQNSTEYLGNQIDDFYQSYLHRSSGSDERAFWIDVIQNGRLTLENEASLFLSSREYESAHGFDDPAGHH